jgi:hypothetical protein
MILVGFPTLVFYLYVMFGIYLECEVSNVIWHRVPIVLYIYFEFVSWFVFCGVELNGFDKGITFVTPAMDTKRHVFVPLLTPFEYLVVMSWVVIIETKWTFWDYVRCVCLRR